MVQDPADHDRLEVFHEKVAQVVAFKARHRKLNGDDFVGLGWLQYKEEWSEMIPCITLEDGSI